MDVYRFDKKDLHYYLGIRALELYNTQGLEGLKTILPFRGEVSLFEDKNGHVYVTVSGDESIRRSNPRHYLLAGHVKLPLGSSSVEGC